MTPAVRRHDPHRRSRIVDACLDVIAAHGVAGTSHRRVAAAADVPLGSMTYHFDGLDDLLLVAFARFAEQQSARFDAHLTAGTPVQDAVVALIRDNLTDQRDLILTQELYTLAAREPSFRVLTNAWMARSRATLERHLDPSTARMLDAVIEGVTLHRALDTEEPDPGVVEEAVRRILAADLVPPAPAAGPAPRA